MKNIIIAVLAALVLIFGGLWIASERVITPIICPSCPDRLGSQEHTELEEFRAGIRFDNSSDIAARPNALARHRFRVGPPSTVILFMNKFDGSSEKLCVAFATAD